MYSTNEFENRILTIVKNMHDSFKDSDPFETLFASMYITKCLIDDLQESVMKNDRCFEILGNDLYDKFWHIKNKIEALLFKSVMDEPKIKVDSAMEFKKINIVELLPISQDAFTRKEIL